MCDFTNWSVGFGRWQGVQLRLHAFFLLFAVVPLYLCTREPGSALVGYAVGSLVILFFSVLAHEIGHAIMAMRVGGHFEQIVIGPWGGLAPAQIPHDPQHELVAAAAGPLTNLVIGVLAASLLLVAGQNPVGLLNPLEPNELLVGAAWLVTLKLAVWLNWVLVLVNLLPVFPLDGGRILCAILWPAFEYRLAVLYVTRVAKVFAFAAMLLAVISWEWGDPRSNSVLGPASVPAWLPMFLLAIVLYFSARQDAARLEDHDGPDEALNYDFSQGYTSLERNIEPGHRGGISAVRRWLEQRREAKLRRQRVLEQEEERRVDDILARLHEAGINGLSSKERAILERVSARYRNRQQS